MHRDLRPFHGALTSGPNPRPTRSHLAPDHVITVTVAGEHAVRHFGRFDTDEAAMLALDQVLCIDRPGGALPTKGVVIAVALYDSLRRDPLGPSSGSVADLEAFLRGRAA